VHGVRFGLHWVIAWHVDSYQVLLSLQRPYANIDPDILNVELQGYKAWAQGDKECTEYINLREAIARSRHRELEYKKGRLLEVRLLVPSASHCRSCLCVTD
jgi:hypothetical protein